MLRGNKRTVKQENMEFCPKCGSRLVSKKGKTNLESSLQFVCQKCGYKEQASTREVTPKVAKVMQRSPQQLIAVIGKKEQKLRTLPTVRIECPKCDNNLSYIWQVQTRGADESSTQFLRCTKCGYTFREYS